MRVVAAVMLLVSLAAVARGERVLHVSAAALPGVRLTEQFRSLREALRVVRAGDRVVLAEGRYDDDLRLERSGRPESPIIVEPAAGARVVIAPGAAWEVRGEHVRLRGLRFQRPVALAGAHGAMDECVLEAAGAGVVVSGADVVLRNCEVRGGLRAQGAHRMLVQGCTFRAGGEAVDAPEGIRISASRDVVVESSRVEGFTGGGIAIDAAGDGAIVRQCLVRGNGGAAVRVEASSGVRIGDSVIIATTSPPVPRGQEARPAEAAGAGVMLASSSACRVERNLLVGNAIGILLHDGNAAARGADAGQAHGLWTREHVVRRNCVVSSGTAQVRGWFEAGDERQWPRRMQGRPAERVEVTEAGPVGLSLEALGLDVGENVYASLPGRVFGMWGDGRRREKRYATLGEFRADLEMEAGSLEMEVPLADPAALDFRLPGDHPVLLMRAYPQGEVPGVRLGARVE